MSALAGILNFDGAPVDRKVLDAFGHRLANHGPDGGGHKQTGAVAMVFSAFHTTRESRLEKQPLATTTGHILAWDGRLDNRAELVAQLRPDFEPGCTDVEIVIASYLRWNIDFLTHLIGDFALSLWDPTSRTLLLARDPFGTRPLYYQLTSQRIVWSSDLASLLDVSTLPVAVDREYIAGYLSTAPELDRTAYESIRSVPPEFALVLREARIEKREFWRPDPQQHIRYRRDSDYEEQFRALFRDAVRCRLRSDGPVWAELSGGLDSSSIVCMADRIIESGDAETSRLETVSYVYENSPASDERRFMGEVEQQRGRAGHHFSEDDSVGRFLELDLATIFRPNPIYRFTARHDWVRARMQQVGSRVLLSGVAGDNVMWAGVEVSPQLADLLVQLRLTSLHQQATLWSQTTQDSYAGILWRGAVLPLLPQTLQSRFDPQSLISPLVDCAFAKQMDMRERSASAFNPKHIKLPSARAQVSMLSAAVRSVASCYYRDRVPTEYRFPFLHRPLIEYLLAIPIEQKLRPGENRSLQRRALKEVLPSAILNRQSKRWATQALCRAFANNWREIEWLFKEPRVCQYGFVDAQAFASVAKRIRHGVQHLAADLTIVLSVELWLRALESRQSSLQQATETEEQKDDHYLPHRLRCMFQH
jgi:asparagine synthase (glutamine-hydrolysing)